MRVIVFDDDCQSFMGKLYTRFGRYFRARHCFIHRDVWEFHHGPIPPKFDIHHVDGDGANNQIDNLEAIERGKHRSMHQKGRKRGPEAVRASLDGVAKWQKSPEGQRVLREIGRKNAHFMHQPKDYRCEQCGKEYVRSSGGRNRFCSDLCKNRWRWEAGKYHTDAVCTVCGETFRTDKYQPGAACSRKCRGVLSGNTRRGIPQGKRGKDGLRLVPDQVG